jgi:hypothetical protein
MTGDNAANVMIAEAARRLAAFVPTDLKNIALEVSGSTIKMVFRNNAQKDINIDGLTDRLCMKGIACTYMARMRTGGNSEEIAEYHWDPERQKQMILEAGAEAFSNSELVSRPDMKDAEGPGVTLHISLDELVKALPAPGASIKPPGNG